VKNGYDYWFMDHLRSDFCVVLRSFVDATQKEKPVERGRMEGALFETGNLSKVCKKLSSMQVLLS